MAEEEEKPHFAPCEVTLEFADGEYLFFLGLNQIAELQEKCDAGLGAIWKRVARHDWRIEDLVETIRLGLIGGGLKVEGGKPNAVEARRLVERYATQLPKQALWETAFAVLAACVQGYEPPGKKKDGDETTTTATPIST